MTIVDAASELLLENILKANLDVICLQEATDAMCQHKLKHH